MSIQLYLFEFRVVRKSSTDCTHVDHNQLITFTKSYMSVILKAVYKVFDTTHIGICHVLLLFTSFAIKWGDMNVLDLDF